MSRCRALWTDLGCHAVRWCGARRLPAGSGRSAGRSRDARGRAAPPARHGGKRLCGRGHAGYRRHEYRERARRRLRPARVLGLRRACARAAHPVHPHHHGPGPQLCERPRDGLRLLGRRARVDVRDPRRRRLLRRRGAHRRRRRLYGERRHRLHHVRGGPLHGRRGRGHRRLHRRAPSQTSRTTRSSTRSRSWALSRSTRTARGTARRPSGPAGTSWSAGTAASRRSLWQTPPTMASDRRWSA